MGEGDKQYKSFKGFKWTVGNEDVPALALVVDDVSKQLHICEPADVITDWALAACSHPTVCIHSATTPSTDYIKMYHDATDAYIDGVGATNIKLAIAGTTEYTFSASTLTLASGNNLALTSGATTITAFTGSASGQSNYTGTGVYGAAGVSVGVKGTVVSIASAGANAGVQIHVQQDALLSASTQVLSGLYITASHGNVTSTNGMVEGVSVFARNSGTGTCINLTGGLFMVYSGSGNSTKYKKGLLVDVLDQATTHPSGGGTQGITIQLNPTSITNNQVDAILINQNSSSQTAGGIVFKGKMGNTSGSHAVISFVGSGDTAADGNKGNIFKFRSGSTTYVVTPAQFLTALGANCTAI